MGTTERLLLIAFAVVVGVGTTWLLVHMLRTRQRVEQAWQAFAQRHGLRLKRGKDKWPQLAGKHRDVSINARVISRGTGDSRSQHTVVSASCRRGLPNNFALRPQGWFFALQKAYGAQDIEIGDPNFDREFVIACADEAAVQALLADLEVRQALLHHADREPGLTVEAGQVVVERSGEVTKPDKLLRMLDAATGAALALEAASDNPVMKQHARAAAGHQQWFLQRNHRRVFVAVMMFPVGFAVALTSAGLLLPRRWGNLGFLIGALFVAVAFKLLWPPRPHLALGGGALTLRRGKETLTFPLQQCRFWCGPWRKSGYFCGSILYLQCGDQQLAIAGAQHAFDDPRYYQVEAAEDGDVMMLRKPFAKLLNSLGYATRHNT